MDLGGADNDRMTALLQATGLRMRGQNSHRTLPAPK